MDSGANPTSPQRWSNMITMIHDVSRLPHAVQKIQKEKYNRVTVSPWLDVASRLFPEHNLVTSCWFALDNLICLAQGREWLPPRLNWLQRWHAVWQRDLPGGERFFDNEHGQCLARYDCVSQTKDTKGNWTRFMMWSYLNPCETLWWGCFAGAALLSLSNRSITTAFFLAQGNAM